MLTRMQQRTRDLSRSFTPHYELEPDGAFRIERYDVAPAFCSFLPGVAGPDGVPLWCMYVDRAQGVVSFGIQDKDHAIAEFLPATWAYQLVGIQGFRTFCKIDGAYYEPFRPVPAEHPDCIRTMRILPDSLEVAEVNHARGLAFNVRYFSPVNQPLGSLVRRITISNISTDARRITALDGLALMVPAGFTDSSLKTLRHIHEAYACVRLARGRVPFYTAKVAAHDEAEVVRLSGGNFYAAWVARDEQWQPVEAFVDPHVVFDAGHDLITPRNFIARESLDRAEQVWENRMPCALAPLDAVLEPEESLTLVAITGFAPHEDLLSTFLARFTRPADVENALIESNRLMADVVAPCQTLSGLPILDAYARQNYLDNVLRGGVPVLLSSAAGPTPLHLYARRHGDLERDYNYFVLPPHPLSSGSGNYRDICQNRRQDVWFYPAVQEHEIKMFVGLLQADGYNPLSVDGYRWRLGAGVDPSTLCPTSDGPARTQFRHLLADGFQPGELLHWAALNGIVIDDHAGWTLNVLAHCDRTLVAHGHEGGYWIDHWTYVTDLLDAYAAVYPDRVTAMLVGAADVSWFDEGASVVPRKDKYALRTAGPLQVNAVVDGTPSPRPLPAVTVFGKLCALLAIKAVSFDYECRGVEMEAGRPGWNDSLNGLPGLFGSSTCEAAETARLAAWLRTHLPRLPDSTFPVGVADFIEQVIADLSAAEYSWDRAATLREQFRARIRCEVSGSQRTLPGVRLAQLLSGVEQRARAALAKSVNPQSGLVHTYYVNKPDGWARPTAEEQSGAVRVADRAKQFIAEPLPLYLEGQVHWLRLQREREHAHAIWHAVRKSPLFDDALQMYKVNECLEHCQPEIGRARTFTRGWFENESIWLHMSYKFLLELLRAGLYDEFFTDASTMLVPFMDPGIYGRSVLENSSFIGSSANPDPRTRGRGFIARMSGSTAEFIHIWLLLTVGAATVLHGRREAAVPSRTDLAGRVVYAAGDEPALAGSGSESPGRLLRLCAAGQHAAGLPQHIARQHVRRKERQTRPLPAGWQARCPGRLPGRRSGHAAAPTHIPTSGCLARITAGLSTVLEETSTASHMGPDAQNDTFGQRALAVALILAVDDRQGDFGRRNVERGQRVGDRSAWGHVEAHTGPSTARGQIGAKRSE